MLLSRFYTICISTLVSFSLSVGDSVADTQAPIVPLLPDDAAIAAKLDSLTLRLQDGDFLTWDSSSIKDSTAKLKGAQAKGEYIEKARYDKSNFDSWKVDTVLQEAQKSLVLGSWRTAILKHGHAFLDAALKFSPNDTLLSNTYTYSDSARYMKTGEYAYRARFRFESDTTFRTREVFPDRNVVRWDYVQYKLNGDTLRHHLYKLEFRDLMDNWLDAIQEFDQVPPEVYTRTKTSSATPVSRPKGSS